MADKIIDESKTLPGSYQIVLPCDPSDFGEFISGLLGKPQTISRKFHGPFDIDRNEIENFYHLVDQRVQQQNEAKRISFTATVTYDDQSSVQLNSIEDLMTYNEVRPLISQAVHLSWGFLVIFRDKVVPAKQQIDVSIVSEGAIVFDEGIILSGGSFESDGLISLRIEHTARTWGADIEAMLSGHIQTLLKQPSKLAQWVQKKSGEIGFGLGALFFLSAVISTFLATGRFLENRLALAAGVKASKPHFQESIGTKVDFLVDIIASGLWPRYFFYAASFIVAALIISIILGIWAGSAAGHKQPSFLLLSKKAELRKARLTREKKRYGLSLCLAVIVNLVCGLAANWIFIRYFQGWVLP